MVANQNRFCFFTRGNVDAIPVALCMVDVSKAHETASLEIEKGDGFFALTKDSEAASKAMVQALMEKVTPISTASPKA